MSETLRRLNYSQLKTTLFCFSYFLIMMDMIMNWSVRSISYPLPNHHSATQLPHVSCTRNHLQPTVSSFSSTRPNTTFLHPLQVPVFDQFQNVTCRPNVELRSQTRLSLRPYEGKEQREGIQFCGVRPSSYLSSPSRSQCSHVHFKMTQIVILRILLFSNPVKISRRASWLVPKCRPTN